MGRFFNGLGLFNRFMHIYEHISIQEIGCLGSLGDLEVLLGS